MLGSRTVYYRGTEVQRENRLRVFRALRPGWLCESKSSCCRDLCRSPISGLLLAFCLRFPEKYVVSAIVAPRCSSYTEDELNLSGGKAADSPGRVVSASGLSGRQGVGQRRGPVPPTPCLPRSEHGGRRTENRPRNHPLRNPAVRLLRAGRTSENIDCSAS